MAQKGRTSRATYAVVMVKISERFAVVNALRQMDIKMLNVPIRASRVVTDDTRFNTTTERIGITDASILVIQDVILKIVVSLYPTSPCRLDGFLNRAQPHRTRLTIAFLATQSENGSSPTRGRSAIRSLAWDLGSGTEPQV
jgi:hypothetical protein